MTIKPWKERPVDPRAEMGSQLVNMQDEIDELRSEVEASERNIEQLTDDLARSREELAALKALVDDPELDGTDGAHPAWWRGHEASCNIFCQKVNDILDGKDDGNGVSNPPWEPTRRRLLVLAEKFLATGGVDYSRGFSDGLREAVAHPVQEPSAYITETNMGDMVWTLADYKEACSYCDDDERPIPLYRAVAELEADAARYHFIREGAFSGQWILSEVQGGWADGMDKTIDSAIEAAIKRGAT